MHDSTAILIATIGQPYGKAAVLLVELLGAGDGHCAITGEKPANAVCCAVQRRNTGAENEAQRVLLW